MKNFINPKEFSLYWFLLEDTNDFNISPVYHGGTWDGVKAVKTTGRGALGVGAYFTTIKSVADSYAKESGGKVIQTALRVNKPLKITNTPQSHPVIDALVALGVNPDKAAAAVEREEEKHGYVGGMIKKLAQAQGYDAIFQFFNGKLREIVIWNADQVKYNSPAPKGQKVSNDPNEI